MSCHAPPNPWAVFLCPVKGELHIGAFPLSTRIELFCVVICCLVLEMELEWNKMLVLEVSTWKQRKF